MRLVGRPEMDVPEVLRLAILFPGRWCASRSRAHENAGLSPFSHFYNGFVAKTASETTFEN